MRSYHKTVVKVGGLLEFKIESWSEHGHMSVYSDDQPLFDGDSCRGYKAIQEEIKRICDIAKANNLDAEVIRQQNPVRT